MATKKKPKVYELYWGMGGPTNRSVMYDRWNKRVTHVSAYSLPQALYLAARSVWFDAEVSSAGGVGVVADRDGWQSRPGREWRVHDGRLLGGSPYRHGRVFAGKDHEEGYAADDEPHHEDDRWVITKEWVEILSKEFGRKEDR